MTTTLPSERILFSKVGGWLVLPAIIHPLLSIGYNIKGAVDLANIISDKMPPNVLIFLVISFALSLLFAGLWMVSAYLAISLNRSFPKFYISLTSAELFVGFSILTIAYAMFNSVPSQEDTRDMFRSILSAAIWIPYMLVSNRVKATFYDIPMPQKLAFKNINTPLERDAVERQQYRHERSEALPLNMVQRIGMVLYWAGAGLGVILAAAGVFALFNSTDKFVAIATLVAAALSWLIGRALKYILVGK